MRRLRWVFAPVVLLTLGAPLSASAQAGAQPAASKTEEARDRYERGLKLYEDGAYDGARIEFERAYALAPTFKLLYNIGVVYAQLGDFVGAIRNLERYLEEGRDEVPAARRADVMKVLGELRSRVAHLNVKTNEPDAEIFVDDVSVGRTPLQTPVAVNPGRRKVTVAKKGRLPATKIIDVASADTASLELELAAPPTSTVYRDTPTRRVPWIGWAATGVLAAGAGVFGYLAINSDSKLDDAKAQPNPDPEDLDSRSSGVKTLGYVADGLAIGAVVVGVVSLYYTIKWGKETTPSTNTGFVIRPAGNGFGGTF